MGPGLEVKPEVKAGPGLELKLEVEAGPGLRTVKVVIERGIALLYLLLRGTQSLEVD